MKLGGIALGLAALSLAAAAGQARLVAPKVDDAVIQGERLPRTLEEYGFFIHADAQVPTLGVVPYRLNTPLFSDGADKLRFIYVPEGQSVSYGEDGLVQFPVGSALIKTFAFGEGKDRRLIETRVLLHRADGWLALPYLWNEEQSEARLAVAGARIDLTTPKGEAISYRVPNKNQCKECHGLNGAVTPIGPKARNMSAEWLAKHFGDVPQGADIMPVWENRSDATTEAAARAYLDVNCAHCHRPGATASNSGLDLRWQQQDPTSIGIMKRPVAAGRGAGAHLFDIVPGKPDQSILLHRMLSNEPGVAMPEVGKATIDEEGAEAVRKWIAEMPQG